LLSETKSQASWAIAVETAQDLVSSARNITAEEDDLRGDIGRSRLAAGRTCRA
jgi:hypothetical protein